MKTHLHHISIVFTLLTGALTAEELLLHEGPEMSVGVDSLAGFEESAEELVFRKQFFIDSDVLRKLPGTVDTVTNPAMDATGAIDAAKATVDLGQRNTFRVIRLDFLRSKTVDTVDFYLIEMLVNGSTEHRIVLMDGSVIKPRLTRKKTE
ncbi:MAG: hypothetical protein EOP85_10845 [Verrucomicrobiaceae bacterium]|nr:MAG: hypothetical protein EOP85_10845 [Verrucomicrobiaceae bacterium]